jgi:hypothetical protein
VLEFPGDFGLKSNHFFCRFQELVSPKMLAKKTLVEESWLNCNQVIENRPFLDPIHSATQSLTWQGRWAVRCRELAIEQRPKQRNLGDTEAFNPNLSCPTSFTRNIPKNGTIA